MAKRKPGSSERKAKEYRRQREVAVLRSVVGALLAKLGGDVTLGPNDMTAPDETVRMHQLGPATMRISIERRGHVISGPRLLGPTGRPL